MASQKQQYTILYGRLSQEDERAGESNSIQHQRDLLEKYARDKGFENTLFLADDGYSGTNFERPSWKKIVEMIEAGEVSTLIVKDASRLGREYLQVGYYMEIYFPLCCWERSEPDCADSGRSEYSDTCKLLLSKDRKNARGTQCAASMCVVGNNGQRHSR